MAHGNRFRLYICRSLGSLAFCYDVRKVVCHRVCYCPICIQWRQALPTFSDLTAGTITKAAQVPLRLSKFPARKPSQNNSVTFSFNAVLFLQLLIFQGYLRSCSLFSLSLSSFLFLFFFLVPYFYQPTSYICIYYHKSKTSSCALKKNLIFLCFTHLRNHLYMSICIIFLLYIAQLSRSIVKTLLLHMFPSE